MLPHSRFRRSHETASLSLTAPSTAIAAPPRHRASTTGRALSACSRALALSSSRRHGADQAERCHGGEDQEREDGAKIARNAITGSKVLNRSLTAADFVASSLPKRPAGRGPGRTEGGPGPAGTIGRMTVRQGGVVVPEAPPRTAPQHDGRDAGARRPSPPERVERRRLPAETLDTAHDAHHHEQRGDGNRSGGGTTAATRACSRSTPYTA